MNALRADLPIDPDDPSHASLLATDPIDWARRATLMVYERHAAALAARAERRARQVERDNGWRAAETLRRDAVNDLRHSCTNYEELVADVAAHYGHGQRDDVIAAIRNRTLRALAHRFPSLAEVCRTIAQERESPPHALPINASERRIR